jgi:hypothetical protein
MRTAPWAWPLMPAMLAVDAVLTPVLVFFAPAVMVIGEGSAQCHASSTTGRPPEGANVTARCTTRMR